MSRELIGRLCHGSRRGDTLAINRPAHYLLRSLGWFALAVVPFGLLVSILVLIGGAIWIPDSEVVVQIGYAVGWISLALPPLLSVILFMMAGSAFPLRKIARPPS